MDGFTVDVDSQRLLNALDRLGDAVEHFTLFAASETAQRIQDTAIARARLAFTRRSGKTEQGVLIYPGAAHEPGFAVLGTREFDDRYSLHRRHLPGGRRGRSWLQRVTQSNVPIWLEYGTKYMLRRPYFYQAAEIEAGPHDRRMREAIDRAIASVGLED